MSYVIPGDVGERAGQPKQEKDFTREERAHIARQVLDAQRTNQLYGPSPVDRDALLKARAHAAECGDPGLINDIDAMLASVPKMKQ